MKRRTFLASLPAIALAGCLHTLGLTDRVVVGEKTLEATEIEDGEERTRTLAVQRVGEDGPEYAELDEFLEGELEEGEPLVVDDELQGELDGSFSEIEYELRVCEDDTDDIEACRAVSVVREDFNDMGVGDRVELRISNDGAGLMEVLDRYEERERYE